MFLCLQKLLSPSPAGKNRYSAKRIKTDLKILISLPLFSPNFLMRKGRRKITLEFVHDLSYLPKYVLDNLDKYKKWIKQ